MASLIFSLTFSLSNDNIIIGLITAQSILIGFAFNVMVYISSQDSLKSSDAIYREDKGKFENVNVLADEIFYNLSYFSTTALMSVAICLIWLTIKSDNTLINAIMDHAILRKNVLHATIEAIALTDVAWKFSLFVTTLESVITFGRLVRRVTFHFQKRRQILGEISLAKIHKRD
ncbi:hypothetical protein [Novosphingobium sp.]|uniref:hypothetical protein n=1 Tax=Novosphingobium sp. TaxID=1874826 RepID=UPI0038BB4583